MILEAQQAYRDMLDRLHLLVNSQGGDFSIDGIEGEARAEAIDGVLGAIERMGGMDPSKRKSADAGGRG